MSAASSVLCRHIGPRSRSTPGWSGCSYRKLAALLKFKIIAALQQNASDTCSGTDARTDRGTFAAASDRSDYRSECGTNTAARYRFFRLAVLADRAFVIDLYRIAISLGCRVNDAGKLVCFAVHRDRIKVQRKLCPPCQPAGIVGLCDVAADNSCRDTATAR